MSEMVCINPLDNGVKIYVVQKLKELGISEYVHISDFVQDEFGYNNKETGDNYPPTFMWNSNISVKLPKHPNKIDQYLFVRIYLKKEEVEKLFKEYNRLFGMINKAILIEDFDNAIETIRDYMDCVCSIEQKCELHATMAGSKEIVYKEKV